MREERPSCPGCGKWMEKGFLLEKGDHNSASVTSWIEGVPERSWLGLRLKGRRALAVTAWRCPSCGLVSAYAPDPPLGP